jgi:predicted nucleic acid-binding protein
MTFANIPTDTRVFVDANILSYYFLRVIPFFELCDPLFRRAARREITLHTAANVAADVIHRAMVSEAITQFGLQPREAVTFLKTNSETVKQLEKYKLVPGWFTQARVNILSITYREIHNSKRFRDTFGFLTNDSIILAAMSRYKIADLATNDQDFRHVPGIRLWMPRRGSQNA